MTDGLRRYRYVDPPEVLAAERPGSEGHALNRAGLEHPGRFTHPVIFRRCPQCQERNLVKDDYFACVICGTELPRAWNIDPPG